MKKVSIKTGMLATDLGYRDSNEMWLFKTEKGSLYGTNTKGGISGKEKTFKQPTQTELQTWLRKKHKIEVAVVPRTTSGVRDYRPMVKVPAFDVDFDLILNHRLNTYEKAMEYGFKLALDFIKNRTKYIKE
jgi:hypothetical protein